MSAESDKSLSGHKLGVNAIQDWTTWLRQQRHQAINITLGLILALGFLGLAITVYRLFTGYGYLYALPIYLIAFLLSAVLFTARRLRDEWRTLGLLILIYAFSVFTLYSGWLAGSGRVFLLAMVVAATVLLNPQAGLFAFGFSLLTYIAFGLAYTLGWHTLRPLPNPVDASPVMIEGVGFALAVGVVAVSLWFFGKALIAAAQANQDARESHTLLNQRAKELEAANSLIAQRTQSFHNIVERSSDGILVVDTDGRICFANRAAEGFFGLTHQELIGSISTFSMSDEGVVEMDFYLENGEKGVAELLIGESEWEGKPAYLAVIRDVTKRNQAEEMLSAAFSYSPVAMSIGLFDSGTYIAVNDVFEKLTGFTSTEVVGRSSRELNLYKNEQDRECIFGLLRDQGYVQNYEFTLRRKNDELRFANVSVELIELEGQRCYLASTIDITERKQAEEALQQRTAQLEAVRQLGLELVTELELGALLQSIVERAVKLVHSAVGKIALYRPERDALEWVVSVDKDWSYIGDTTLLGEGLAGKVWELGREIIVNDYPNWEGRIPYRVDDYTAVMGVPIRWGKEFLGVLGVEDQYPRKFTPADAELLIMLATQAAVAIQNARLLEQVQRHAQTLEERVQQRTAELEAKARELESFSYSVSHDLKAPLRGIDGYSRLLQESCFEQLDEEGRLFLQLIRAGVDQMRQLIDDLLAYSRLERRSLTTTQIQLAGLVDAIVAERAAEIEQRKVQIKIELNCESVEADAEGLRQALRNLLDNALKFTRDTTEPLIEIGGSEQEGACLLWVRDNGIGFDMRYHDRIFEIFQRLQRSEEYPGTGIGLAIVRKALQRMGGRVWAESVSGVGATFYLEIPIIPAYSGVMGNG